MPLIDLSDAVNVVEGYRDRNPDLWSLCNSIKFDIAELPTISPDEVRGVGEWLNDVGEFGFPEIPCSVCGYKSGHYGFKYCPNCGAKIVPKEMAVRNED